MDGRRVLVAGGAGFLGSHLCERLLEDGYRVQCVDDFSTGRAENVQHLRRNDRFRLVVHDVVEPLDLDVEAIYNLASAASPSKYQLAPERTLRSNVFGTANLLMLAQRHGAAFFQASTSEIYGDPEVHPQPETYWGHVNPVGPRSCYDEGKRCAETFCDIYGRHRGVRVRIGRIFNTYGPCMRSDDGRVVSNFIVQALLNRPLTVYGSGTQTRSLCYVDDLIDLIVLLMKSRAAIVGPVNCGNPAEITVLELAERIRDLTGSRSRIVFKSLPVDDPVRRCPDITRALELGWRPRRDLSVGLTRTIEYFDEVLAAGRSNGSSSLAAAGAR